MEQILLTGGAGFIGSNLIQELLNLGLYQVTCIDNFDAFYPRSFKENNIALFKENNNFIFIEGDIRKRTDLEKVEKVDIIIHLAAKAGVRASISDPLLYQDFNIAGTQNLLEFAKVKRVKQFIFASSSSVYGTNSNIPWREEERLLPISPYASSKLADEMLGHVYMHLYGIRFVSLRFFTVYGPRMRPDLAIYKFFDCVINNKPITIYGDGNTGRDYTYISDVINGIKAAIHYSSSSFEIINLGNNNLVKLNQLIMEIENICEKRAIINRIHEQPGDVLHTLADISKAQKLLNYYPLVDLKNGLLSFYNWFQCEGRNFK